MNKLFALLVVFLVCVAVKAQNLAIENIPAVSITVSGPGDEVRYMLQGSTNLNDNKIWKDLAWFQGGSTDQHKIVHFPQGPTFYRTTALFGSNDTLSIWPGWDVTEDLKFFTTNQDVNITNFRIRAGESSDMLVSSITVDFSTRAWHYFTNFVLVNLSTRQELAPRRSIGVADFVELTAGQHYRYSYPVNILIGRGQTVYVKLSGRSADQITRVPGTDVKVLSSAVRATDERGVTSVASLPTLTLPVISGTGPYGDVVYWGP